MFDRLAQVLYSSSSYEEVYAAIVSGATRLVDGCDHASIMLRHGGDRFATVSASDDVARMVDALERQYQDGPCVDAIVDESPQMDPDLMTASQWPAFARAVLRETPVRGAAGFRIVAAGTKVGALNLFSDRAGAFTDESANQGMVLASFAAIAISAVQNQVRADTLAHGLDSNREIGKAIGLMMAFHKIPDTEAFELLRRTSQDMNIKLTEVARKVVQHHNDGHGSAPHVESASTSRRITG